MCDIGVVGITDTDTNNARDTMSYYDDVYLAPNEQSATIGAVARFPHTVELTDGDNLIEINITAEVECVDEDCGWCLADVDVDGAAEWEPDSDAGRPIEVSDDLHAKMLGHIKSSSLFDSKAREHLWDAM